MRWILLWVLIGANGEVSSGSAEFETRLACQGGGNALDEAAATGAKYARKSQPRVSFNCVEKSSGER